MLVLRVGLVFLFVYVPCSRFRSVGWLENYSGVRIRLISIIYRLHLDEIVWPHNKSQKMKDDLNSSLFSDDPSGTIGHCLPLRIGTSILPLT